MPSSRVEGVVGDGGKVALMLQLVLLPGRASAGVGDEATVAVASIQVPGVVLWRRLVEVGSN